MTVRQFVIPKVAGDAVDLATVKSRGLEAGVPDDRFGVSPTRGGYRVTCSVHMAVFLAELLKRTALTSTATVVVECSLALKTILDELARPDHNGVMANVDPATLRFPNA